MPSQTDLNGKDLLIGDWVRVVAVPISIQGMPEETLHAFSSAVGSTFQIESFDETGALELDLWPKISLDTIWIEPYCVERTRRYKKLSQNFLRTLAIKDGTYPPRYEVGFSIRYEGDSDPYDLGLAVAEFGDGGGFTLDSDAGVIEGSLYIEKRSSRPLEKLSTLEESIEQLPGVVDVTMSAVEEF